MADDEVEDMMNDVAIEDMTSEDDDDDDDDDGCFKNPLITEMLLQKEAEMFVLEKSGQISVMKAERERRRIARKQMGLINYYAAGLSLAKGNTIKKRDYLERQIPIPTYNIVKGEVVLTFPDLVVLPGDEEFARQMDGEQHDFDPNQRTGRSALSG